METEYRLLRIVRRNGIFEIEFYTNSQNNSEQNNEPKYILCSPYKPENESEKLAVARQTAREISKGKAPIEEDL